MSEHSAESDAGWLRSALHRLLPKPLPRREDDDDNFSDPCYWV